MTLSGNSGWVPETAEWRVGKHYGIHVYAVRPSEPVRFSGLIRNYDDVPVATFLTPELAETAVRDHNFAREAFSVQSDKSIARRRVIAEIQRTRLGGVDRITTDMPESDPISRYAHICQGPASTTLHTTESPDNPDALYEDLLTPPSVWTLVGVIDLDTGDVAESRNEVQS